MKGSKWTQDPDVLVLIIGVLIILIWIVMQVRLRFRAGRKATFACCRDRNSPEVAIRWLAELGPKARK